MFNNRTANKRSAIYQNVKTVLLIVIGMLSITSFSGCQGNTDTKGPDMAPDTASNVPIEKVSLDEDDSQYVEDNSSKRISFLAAGDNIIHMSVYNDAMSRAATAVSAGETGIGKYYFDDMYKDIAPMIANADIAFVNQEGPIAGDEFGISGHPNFNAPSAAGDTLVRLGFDIVNIANNHMLDMDTLYRGTGYLNTVNYWKNKDVFMIGGYENQADYDNVRVYEYNGVDIAFLSYTYGTNGLTLNSGSPDMVVPLINDNDIVRQLAIAKQKAELVFVSIHFGDENTFTPNAEQKRLAKLITNNGADVIIGHHTHTIQPMEWMTSDDGSYKTLVIYSLGNMISTMLHSYNMVGGIVTFDIVKEGSKRAYIDNPIMNPIVCHYAANSAVLDEQELPTRYGVEVYRMENYTEDLAQANGTQLYGTFNVETLRKYVTDTIAPEFLPDYLK